MYRLQLLAALHLANSHPLKGRGPPPPMAASCLNCRLDHWSQTLLSKVDERDPVFACHARNELGHIARAYPYGTFLQPFTTGVGTRSTRTTPILPGPPSGAPPIFAFPRLAFTPLRSGGSPNGGVQGLQCACGNLAACRCSNWRPPTPLPLPASPPRPKSPFAPMSSGGGTPNTGVQGLPAPSSCSNRWCPGTCHSCCSPTPCPPPVASFAPPFNTTSSRSPFAISSNPLPELPRSSPFRSPFRTTLPSPPVSQGASPARGMPALPHVPPDAMAWTPHPAPHPGIPHNLNAQQANALTGGYPLPGAAAWWTPGVQQHPSVSFCLRLNDILIPNPFDSTIPIFDWDLSVSPALAKFNAPWEHRDIKAHLFTNAVEPPQKEITVRFDHNDAQDLWGPIKVLNGGEDVLVWHVLTAIWEYFQTPIAPTELVALTEFDSANHAIILDAASRRCANTPGLPSWESTRGPRRIDILGDNRKFWGFWISLDGSANGFHLNLGKI